MTNEIDWDNAPEGAEFFAAKTFYKRSIGRFLFWHHGEWLNSDRRHSDMILLEDYQERPQPKSKYIYGVEYPTNGQKPDLPDDVIVEQYSLADDKWHKGCASLWNWGARTILKFRIVDERHKPAETAQDELKQPDPVNHPRHYAIAPGVEAIDIIKASLTPEQFEGYLLGNFLKYRLRAGDKDDLQQDIAKSNWYRERLNQR